MKFAVRRLECWLGRKPSSDRLHGCQSSSGCIPHVRLHRVQGADRIARVAHDHPALPQDRIHQRVKDLPHCILQRLCSILPVRHQRVGHDRKSRHVQVQAGGLKRAAVAALAVVSDDEIRNDVMQAIPSLEAALIWCFGAVYFGPTGLAPDDFDHDE